MQQITLYVQEFLVPDLLAYQSNPSIIAYNNKILKESDLNDLVDYVSKFNEAGYIVPAGRYICMTNISIEENKYLMQFVDLQKDEVKAKIAAAKLDTEQTQLLFMQTFYEVVEKYEQNYNSVVLVKGIPPALKP